MPPWLMHQPQLSVNDASAFWSCCQPTTRPVVLALIAASHPPLNHLFCTLTRRSWTLRSTSHVSALVLAASHPRSKAHLRFLASAPTRAPGLYLPLFLFFVYPTSTVATSLSTVVIFRIVAFMPFIAAIAFICLGIRMQIN